MLVYAGIDEAGYGPVLGPLCVACSGFILPDANPDDGAPNLWRTLKNAVCRKRTDKKHRIAIDDSKNLKGANSNTKLHPLLHLERGVLSFLSTLDPELPVQDDLLYNRCGAMPAQHLWYQPQINLPVSMTVDQLRIARSRLQRDLDRNNVRLFALRCEAIDPVQFNDLVQRMGTKAAVNIGAVFRHIDAIWQQFPQEHPRVIVDRQGGRTHYREELQLAFPDAAINVLAERENLSRYRLVRHGSPITVSFQIEAERGHLPVALASMTAKYIRELQMMRLNRFFAEHMPELKPTAGYFSDGRRFIEDVEPVIESMRLRRDALVRCV